MEYHLEFALFFLLLFSTMTSQDLFAVKRTDGTFYQGVLPVSPTSSDDWIKSAKIIGESGWNVAKLKKLSFHPDGTMYGYCLQDPSSLLTTGTIYKAPPPSRLQPLSFFGWLNNATRVCTITDLSNLCPFFDPDGKLYLDWEDKLYTVPSNSTLHLQDRVRGWCDFKFLFFDPEGILYGVENGKLHKRGPPTAPDDDWLATSTIIGTVGWSDFQFLFFMSSGELYGVYQDKFYKGSTPTQSIDAHTWLASSTLIGSSGWSQFKFLMSPLHNK